MQAENEFELIARLELNETDLEKLRCSEDLHIAVKTYTKAAIKNNRLLIRLENGRKDAIDQLQVIEKSMNQTEAKQLEDNVRQ